MQYFSRIVLFDDGVEVLGPEAMKLIRLIDELKSIKDAASAMKISTARAWKYIRAVEKTIGASAVVKSKRGVDIYSVHISPACRNLLDKYERFISQSEAEIRKAYEQIF